MLDPGRHVGVRDVGRGRHGHARAALGEPLPLSPGSPADIVVVDAPARSHGKELTELVRHAETIIVPVLPSTIDMQATTTFVEELKNVGKIQRKQAKIGTVANRVRDNTLIWGDLDEYLSKIRVPYIAALREAQNYVRAYTRGLGIFELPEYLAWPDWEEWEPLTAWLRSKRSQP